MRLSTGVAAAAVGSLVVLASGCSGGGSSGSVSWSPSPPASVARVAHCPPGATPDNPGPADQQRPTGFRPYLPAVMDGQSGRMVVWEPWSKTTWTFDVCANTWQPMHPTAEPALGSTPRLVYDSNADLTLALSFTDRGLRVWTYSVETNRWTQLPLARTFPPVTGDSDPGANGDVVFDPATDRVLILVPDWQAAAENPTGTSPPTSTLWAYALATNTVTELAGPVPTLSPDQVSNPAVPSLLSDDTNARRLVLTLLGSPGQTWTFDPRTGAWAQGPSWTLAPRPGAGAPPSPEPPSLSVGYSESGGEVTFDPAIGRTVVFSAGTLATYDAVAGNWTLIAPGPEWPTSQSQGFDSGPLTRVYHTLVDDPVNQRILMLGGWARMPPDYATQILDDVWAYYPATNTWTELVPVKHPVTAQ